MGNRGISGKQRARQGRPTPCRPLWQVIAIVGGITCAIPSCATRLQLSPASAQLRASLTEERARAIIQSALEPDARGRGGATKAKWKLTEPAMRPIGIKVVARTIEFQSPGPAQSAGDEPEAGCKTLSNNLQATNPREELPTVCTRHLSLDKLWHIRVSDEPDASETTVAGYLVDIQESVSSTVLVNIPPTGLEPLLAALTYYSPDAQIMKGAGF